MSNRHHLPAGQQNTHRHGGGNLGMPPPPPSGVDMANINGPPGAGGATGAAGGGGGPRRRQINPQYMPQYPQPINPQMYANYMQYGPQGPQQYYGMPHQGYPNGMPSPGYMSYQNYPRSPPSMSHQFAPMPGMHGGPPPHGYHRPQPQSPAFLPPYHPPEVPDLMPPHTPSSTHSSQVVPQPTQVTPQTINAVPVEVAAPAPPTPSAQQASPEVVRSPFRPPLPWLSRPDAEFPVKIAKSRRRRRVLDTAVSLPVGQHEANANQSEQAEAQIQRARSETPSTQDHPSEDAPSTSPTTPSSTHRPRADTATSVTPTKGTGTSRNVAPAIPAMPSVPRSAAKPAGSQEPKSSTDAMANGDQAAESHDTSAEGGAQGEHFPQSSEAKLVESTPPKAPTSWANLFAKSSIGAPRPNGVGPTHENSLNEGQEHMSHNQSSIATQEGLFLAVRDYTVGCGDKLSFIEPRGLINTGNMCYMNSVLQVLMFCVPFYDFLDLTRKLAPHKFNNSSTPLLDALVMFMQEYKVIKSASTREQLQRSLKAEDLERYGEPFTPEFVYEAIRRLSRFDGMRRGHQQDAEEFLGFLLQSLDDECTTVMGGHRTPSEVEASDLGAGTAMADFNGLDDTWLEVGRKQRAAVTRSSGSNSSTPINKVFGGLLRSEFRVPGLKDSITTEPYQPLQLDIGSPDVRNVLDALRGLTRLERIQGDFNSPRGKDVTATKQVYIETLPPVLILHLKRFQFDAEGHGTIKIWKKIGYPLELEIPREAISRQRRQTMGDGATPRYRLISVVYHHGKNASGGHYTVDVRRQDGQEWIRLDDTVIRRIRSEDVAANGAEEDIKDRETRKGTPPAGSGFGSGSASNRFGAMNDEDTGDEDGWKQVTAPTGSSHKRWSSVVNEPSNGSAKGKPPKDNSKDNKVAYLLFYQRM